MEIGLCVRVLGLKVQGVLAAPPLMIIINCGKALINFAILVMPRH